LTCQILKLRRLCHKVDLQLRDRGYQQTTTCEVRVFFSCSVCLRETRLVLDLTKPFDAAVWALALAAFWDCRRLGELTVPTIEKFDPKYHEGNAPHSRPQRRAAKATTLSLPWTKSTRERGGKLTLTARDGQFCPAGCYFPPRRSAVQGPFKRQILLASSVLPHPHQLTPTTLYWMPPFIRFRPHRLCFMLRGSSLPFT
jgi:hypothetical protein